MDFYTLRQAINENVAARVETGTHEFFGGITESFNEFNLMMSESALEIDTDVRMGNEVMIEAVSMGVSAADFELINESIGGTVVAKVKAFFRSVVEYIKGLISKLKTYVAGLSKSTNTWHSKMKADVEKAGRDRSITADFTWEAYKWDHSKMDGLYTLAEKVADIKAEGFSLDGVDAYIKDATSDYEVSVKLHNSTGGRAGAGTINPAKGETKYVDGALKTYKAAIGSALGVRGDVDGYKSTLAETVKGKSMSSQKGIDSKYSNMLDFIDKCTDKIDKITELYEKSKTRFENAISALDAVEAAADVEMVSGLAEDNKKALLAAKEVFTNTTTFAKRMTSYGQSVFNGICALQVSLTKECAMSYMKVLSKLAMAKPKK